MSPDVRSCAWCAGPIRPGARRDAITCSTRCRQARQRFAAGLGAPPPATADRALRLAYADPPYPGLARRYYADHPDYAGEVDHAALIRRLSTYDGWALSTSSRALRDLLPLCPPGVRVAAWHRGERPTRSGGPLAAWEPVIYHGGRPLHVAPAGQHDTSLDAGATCREDQVDASEISTRRVDSLVYRPGHRTTDPGRVIGTKPARYIRWVLDLLGALPGDDLTDLYPGSGGVARAWQMWSTP